MTPVVLQVSMEGYRLLPDDPSALYRLSNEYLISLLHKKNI